MCESGNNESEVMGVKMTVKMIGMSVVALLMAGVVYPILHEGGHGIMTWLVGGHVIEVQWYRQLSILCDVGASDVVSQAAVGMSGILFPLLVCLLVGERRFWLWYGRFIMKGIVCMSSVFSAVSVCCFAAGHPLAEDDFSQILSLWPSGVRVCLLGLIGMGTALIVSMCREHPFLRCWAYIGKGGIGIDDAS